MFHIVPPLRRAMCVFVILLLSSVSFGTNPIVAENNLPGNPASEWDISGAGDLSIQGFASPLSVNTGSVIDFKIDVQGAASNYTIKIYRLGYYNGDGARLIADLGSFPGVAQPVPLYETATGKTDCSNWSVSTSWNSSGALSGVYIAKITRSDNNGSSHIAFIVRNDGGNSALLFKTSDATWQAYNGYGGNSLYVNNSGTPVPGFNHATKVSYNRPFYTRAGGGGSSASEDWLFYSEYPMIRWLERNGYDVSYTTDMDMDRDASVITPSIHKVLLSVGHDEYWSAAERLKFETARNNGVHLAFFSGNEVYWKTRWEDSHGTLVCYKEGTQGENICGGKCDPLPNVWTGLWRDGCAFPSADGCNPENALTGQLSWQGSTGAITVPDTYKQLRFWRNTAVATLGSGQTATLSSNTLGYEWDPETNNGKYPPGRIRLSNTFFSGKTHHLSLYRHSSGALVFGAGTVQWSWGLDGVHDGGGSAEDARMQQATINILADMGVLPDNIQGGMTASSPVDATAPSSTISSPLQGAFLPAGNTVNITGTASDVDGVVAGVEISFDGGVSWALASGTNNWSFSWVPTSTGAATIHCRAYDDNGNMETTGTAPAANAINITITAPVSLPCPCSVFQPTATPALLNNNDGQAIEVGMKFKSSQDGYITGVRFYKATGDNGTHIGHLWSSGGTLLASVTFTGETASGWQQMSFPTPVAIEEDDTYIISYHSSANFYTATYNYFSNAVINGDLRALADGEDGPNGVYIYSAVPAFPSSTYQQSNYWVDVVYETTIGPDVTAPTVSSVSPASNAIGASINTAVSAVFSEAMDPLTISGTTFELRDASNTLVAGNVSYNSGTRTATFTPSSALSYSALYTATLTGGGTDPRIKDVAGNALAANYSWSFTTASAPPPPPNEGPGGPILVISAAANPFSRYPVEILRAEGFNEFSAMDISLVNATVLNSYDVVILGEMPVNGSQVTMLSDWVNAGGTLIALRPHALLSPLLGITSAGGNLSDKYLLFNTGSGPGAGLVNQTIQFHGTADHYTLNGAAALAMLYSDATTASTYPAVTTIDVGANGGKAIAFTYDLARSIVYTRQGNPAWAGQSRDGQPGPIRSDNLYFGNAAGDPQPDWIDFNKVDIPQADEQQHLLSNIIALGNLHRKPLPRFWFLPRKLKAAIVMTGDDHANGGTIGRFNQYLGFGNNSPQDVLDWKAIRGTSYIYTSTNNSSTITDAQAAAFEAQGFEIAAHITTNCGNWTSPTNLDNNYYIPQLAEFGVKWPSVPVPSTNRTHCIAWSDWATQPKVEAAKGIRLDCNYYYWPASWVLDRPGMFTGSGMPMRFADLDGTLIDCYQVTTQMTDESGINYANHISSLLDKAIGPEGYYGVFCANMHTDVNGGTSTAGSDAIISAAQLRQLPVISARQMLTWLDGRNSSFFGAISWSGNDLSFTVSVATGAHQLQGMVPVTAAVGQLTGITRNGSPVSYTTEVIKGINYAFFDAAAGNYVATYLVDNTGPVITNITATPHMDGTATITWTTNEAADSKVDYSSNSSNLNLNSTSGALVTSHSILLTGLSSGVTYYFRVTSADASSNSTTEPVSPATLSFCMPSGPCASDVIAADFAAGTADVNTIVIAEGDGAVSLKPSLYEEFSGTGVPSGWTDAVWDGQGGAITTYSGGQVTVNGTHLSYNTAAGPGTTLEFTATFTAGNFQNVGFSADAAFNNPWMVIGRGGAGDNHVYARNSNNETVSLGSTLLGSPHVYRIQWNTDGSFTFYVDGVLIGTPGITQTVLTNMIIQISDYPAGGVGLSVDRISATPYSTPGVFISRVFDAGSVKDWGVASWTETVPVGTTLSLYQRQAASAGAISGASWVSIPSNGATIGGTSQFIQYKAVFATSNTALTPVLKDISFSCSDPVSEIPVVTTEPASQSVCTGSPASFVSAATGTPVPTVQWQVSTDNGSTWNDILSATNVTYTFTTSIADHGKKYKAIWTNTAGIAESNVATLTVNPLPTATISAVTNPICPGGQVELQLANASGASPYTLVVNGTTYTNVTAGQTFATFNTTEQSIWGNGGSPVSPSVTDNQPIEVGTKFRSALNGYITGIRFYKGITNTGSHTANLWTSGGTLLASVPFSSETASGWQEVHFTTPVAVQANTTYIASYFSQGGYFAISPGFFTGSGVTNGPLTALQAGVDGPNGVYRYWGGFPNNGNTANYWVDVLFTETNNSTNVFDLTSITDANGCTATGSPLSSVTVTTSPLPAGTITAAATTVCEGSPVNLTFTSTTGSGPFSLVINGNNYPNINSGVPFTAGTAVYSPTPVSIWNVGTTGGSQTADNAATELGVKVKSSVPGTISGIRFYKTGTDVLNFTGSLWAVGNTTTPLATATYTSDNTAGWKQINFTTPVPITANTSYIASYFSPSPNYYAYTANGLASPVVSGPLTAEASSYQQPGPGYPGTSSSANYWVDVVFNGTTSTSVYNLTGITSAAGCSATGNPISTVSVSVNPSTVVSAGTYGTVCADAADITLIGSPIGGTFSGVGVTGNLFDPSVGTQTITYTYTNEYGCTNSATTVITVNPVPIVSAGTYGPVCADAADITLIGSPIGGTFTGVGVTGNLFDPSVGTQTITYTYTNGSGCTNSATTVITVNSLPVVSGTPLNVLCNGGATGSIDLSVSGGSGPYSYLWSNGAVTEDISGLSAGTYHVTVTNATGCTAAASFTITEPPVLGVSVNSIIHISCAGTSTGSVTVIASGGVLFATPSPHYEYSIDGGSSKEDGNFNGLSAGIHTVTVRDANGCTQSVTVTITQATNTDVSLGSVFSDNIFTGNGEEITVVYNISELAGKSATPGTLRIYKPAGYIVLFDNAQTSSLSMAVDNAKWMQTASNSLYDEFSRTGPGGNNTLGCHEFIRLSFTIRRSTFNISTFNLNAQFRVAASELILNNNTNSLLLTGE